MLDGIDCSICGVSFKDDDMVLMVKSQFKLGSTSIFFKQTPVSLAHLKCTDQEIIENNKGRTINDVMNFFGQKHIYEFMTTKSAYKEDNKHIMKELGIECQK